MLGTVQFGLPYGIANKRGQPTAAEVREMLAVAWESGVNCLDTAAAYGESEEVLGRALVELGLADKMVIVTKLVHLLDQYRSHREADLIVEQSVARSLRWLRLESLPICLFHRDEHWPYVESLYKLKERGLVRHVGCSTMTPEPTRGILTSGVAEAVQIPSSVLDQRFTRSGVLRLAAEHRVACFMRSIFLQGLLLLSDEETLPELADVMPVRQALRQLAAEAGMPVTEMAVRYVLALEGVTCAVVGMETVAQVRENLAFFAKGPLDAALVAEIEQRVPDLPDQIVMPNLWSKRMADIQPVARSEGESTTEERRRTQKKKETKR